MKSQPPRVIAAIVAIVLAAIVLVTNRLGATDVCSANEAVEAVFVQQMVEHGHLLFPLENGVEPMYKPPLFHWTAYALDRFAGRARVTAENLRMTAALYAIAGVVMTIAFALWLFGADGSSGAILAGLALAGSYQYVSQGRFGRVDMTLCFFEAAALFTFARWIAPERDAVIDTQAHRMLLYVLAIAMGLGVLAKGSRRRAASGRRDRGVHGERAALAADARDARAGAARRRRGGRFELVRRVLFWRTLWISESPARQ